MTGMAGAGPDDRRLDAPTFHRNHGPMLEVLRDVLSARPGDVVEIGSGTGQHIAAFAEAMPELTWWPTDLSARHLESIAAWRRESPAENLRMPVALDASAPDWGFGAPDRPPAGGLAALFSANVIHISPIAVTHGLFRGAGRHLGPDGCLMIYGPFRRDGVHTAQSNARFDASLRAEDPEWGVRDTADLNVIAAEHGLILDRTVDMPANNFILVYARAR
ncbi:MAG: DUF938 domain-containing protein [Hyphomicrobiales bacterium]